MDLLTCAILSGVEAYTLLHYGLIAQVTLKTCVAQFVLQYLLLKFYRCYVYPRYLSPLRGIPGPMVNNYAT